MCSRIRRAPYSSQHTQVNTLDFLEKTFNVKYPLPKPDLIAAPTGIRGMENWGLVIVSGFESC